MGHGVQGGLIGSSNSFTQATLSTTTGSQSCVRIKRTSQCFHPEVGIRQGCNLSPNLFNIFSELLVLTDLEALEGGFQIGGIRLTTLRYADDIVLIAGCQGLQELI